MRLDQVVHYDTYEWLDDTKDDNDEMERWKSGTIVEVSDQNVSVPLWYHRKLLLSVAACYQT